MGEGRGEGPSVIPADAGVQQSPPGQAPVRGEPARTTPTPSDSEVWARNDPSGDLLTDYDAAKERADTLGRLIRASGQYPLLGGGDINLYSLFVERAMGLIKPDGFVGLLTPSGIYADKTAARFFKTVSTGGRVAGLFDFENKKIFFKDIHASFKFCALIFGGAKRHVRSRPSAPSSCTTRRPSTIPTAASRWRRTTSPA